MRYLTRFRFSTPIYSESFTNDLLERLRNEAFATYSTVIRSTGGQTLSGFVYLRTRGTTDSVDTYLNSIALNCRVKVTPIPWRDSADTLLQECSLLVQQGGGVLEQQHGEEFDIRTVTRYTFAATGYTPTDLSCLVADLETSNYVSYIVLLQEDTACGFIHAKDVKCSRRIRKSLSGNLNIEPVHAGTTDGDAIDFYKSVVSNGNAAVLCVKDQRTDDVNNAIAPIHSSTATGESELLVRRYHVENKPGSCDVIVIRDPPAGTLILEQPESQSPAVISETQRPEPLSASTLARPCLTRGIVQDRHSRLRTQQPRGSHGRSTPPKRAKRSGVLRNSDSDSNGHRWNSAFHREMNWLMRRRCVTESQPITSADIDTCETTKTLFNINTCEVLLQLYHHHRSFVTH
ncbi:POU domain transcription factor, class 1 [Sarotherodon galilaeus]